MSVLTVKCPICQRPVVWQDSPSRPFCSERCRLMDLGCWVDETYRLAAPDETTVLDTKLPAADD